jgi:N-acetylmuramoyl-L-alanine amidase
MLQRIVEAECTDCSIEAKENVASVIINRILSTDFPDDMKSVIFDDNQFSPIYDGRYYKVDITQTTKEAVTEVLNTGVTHDSLYFCNLKDVENLSNKIWLKQLTYVFKDDSGHSFYR